MLALKYLNKSYGTLIAVNNLSLTVDRSGLFAFLSPNGGASLRAAAGDERARLEQIFLHCTEENVA